MIIIKIKKELDFDIDIMSYTYNKKQNFIKNKKR